MNEELQYAHLIEESPQFIFNMFKSAYQEQNYDEAYTILHLLVYKKTIMPNLHYNLAKCAQKLSNEELMILHLKEELSHYDNLAALNLLEKIQTKQNFPYLTVSLSLLIIIIHFLFFSNYSQLDIFLYALHRDNISIFSTITSLFFHSSTLHLTTNILLLLLIGSFLEKFLSKFQYILIFFFSGITSNLIQILVFAPISDFNVVIGISGSIFGFLAVMMFRAPLLSITIANIKIPLLVLILIAYIVSLLSLSQTSYVAHYAHLFGFLTGSAIACLTNSFLRNRFYPLLVFIFGVMLSTSFIESSVNAIFIYPIFDLLGAIICISYSYAFLITREEYLQRLE